jgi:hypothetical protein
MDTQKLAKILNLIEIAETNLKTAQILLKQFNQLGNPASASHNPTSNSSVISDESDYLEVVEGNYDGEHMLSDDGQVYTVPANYASKTKLVIGDRMKRVLTDNYREIYKVIQKAPSKRVVGTFSLDQSGEFIVLVDSIPHPIKVLKASITFAIKHQNLKSGDTVALLVPQNGGSSPIWGAFDTVVKHTDEAEEVLPKISTTENIATETHSMDLHPEEIVVSKPKPSLESLKESAPNMISDALPSSANMPNPFDSLDEFKI